MAIYIVGMRCANSSSQARKQPFRTNNKCADDLGARPVVS